MSGLARRLRDGLGSGGLHLPELGGGDTTGRWRALAAIARQDLAEGRLAEAHVDARQILREAGRPASDGCLYGVWASEHPRWSVTAGPSGPGRLVFDGAKAFCTGAGLLDRALVTARPSPSQSGTTSDVDGPGPAILIDLDLSAVTHERIDASGWTTGALADTVTAVVDLTGIEVATDQVIGPPGWYLDRPGFWDGAIGPAACWAGGAMGLVDHATDHPPSDPHGQAHLGAMVARAWSLEAALDRCGLEIDAEASPTHQSAEGVATTETARRRRALVVRHLVDVGAAEIQDRFARALGPRPLASDRSIHERDHALSLYRRQCHAERDLEALGRLVDP